MPDCIKLSQRLFCDLSVTKKKKNMNDGGAFIKIEIRFNVLAVQLFPFVTSGVLIPLSHIYEDVDVIASTQQPGGRCSENSPTRLPLESGRRNRPDKAITKKLF